MGNLDQFRKGNQSGEMDSQCNMKFWEAYFRINSMLFQKIINKNNFI